MGREREQEVVVGRHNAPSGREWRESQLGLVDEGW